MLSDAATQVPLTAPLHRSPRSPLTPLPAPDYCSVTNFDDALCVKPMNGNGRLATCSEDILIEDSNVTLGVGITIGSVPPNDAVNCVRNVTFRRINMVTPIKGIHVKVRGASGEWRVACVWGCAA